MTSCPIHASDTCCPVPEILRGERTPEIEAFSFQNDARFYDYYSGAELPEDWTGIYQQDGAIFLTWLEDGERSYRCLEVCAI